MQNNTCCGYILICRDLIYLTWLYNETQQFVVYDTVWCPGEQGILGFLGILGFVGILGFLGILGILGFIGFLGILGRFSRYP